MVAIVVVQVAEEEEILHQEVEIVPTQMIEEEVVLPYPVASDGEPVVSGKQLQSKAKPANTSS